MKSTENTKNNSSETILHRETLKTAKDLIMLILLK